VLDPNERASYPIYPFGFRIVMRGRHRLNNNTGKTLSRKRREQHVPVLRK
jgi:hypothetical protein